MDESRSEHGRIGFFSRDQYWTARIEEDHKTLSAKELAKKWGKQLASLERQRFIDPLTGIWTLRGVQYQLAHEMSMAKKYSFPVSVMMFDLDGFKQINETMGHSEGNRAIKTMAQFLKGTTEETGIIARYGGDEFILVCPMGSEAAKSIADKIVINLKDHMKRNKFNVTSSVGLTTLRSDNHNVMALINEADQALKSAKVAGKNRVEVYNQGDQKAA